MGIGKSCLCNRFVAPLADDFHIDHISVLSQVRKKAQQSTNWCIAISQDVGQCDLDTTFYISVGFLWEGRQ